MADQDDVRRLALALPEVTEAPDSFHFYIGGKLFVWVYPERVHPKKSRVPNPDVIVARVSDLSEKEALLASDPTVFFNVAHYDGYKAVLVRLPVVSDATLAEVVTDAWRAVAPAALVKAHDAG
jgi:hypothetical protein